MAPETVGNKNEKVGEVVSTKMQKTIVVEVSRRVPHPLYKRIVTKRKKFYAHDEKGEAKMGDWVRIVECRPLSRLKRWRLGDIVRRAAQVDAEPADLDIKI
jgi:small subunit ribosomal protein S17